jgi:uncharacterized protein (DUF362 family)
MVSRRKFLQAGAVAATAGAIVPTHVFGQGAKPLVAVAKGAPADAVRRAMEALGGMKKFVKQGARVVIKPNMGFPNPPEWATTTNPQVVRAIAELCLEAGAQRVIIFDNPLRDAELCKDKTGIAKAMEGLKGIVVALPDDPKFYQETPVFGGQQLKSTAVAKEVLRADCLISVPVAKSHSATGISMGIKGLMGLVCDRKVFHEQLELNRAVAELLLVIKPKLTIIDAIQALVTRGPSGPGKVEKLDTIVACEDPVAADSYAVGLARWYDREFTGDQVKHLKIAAEMGLGVVDVKMMDIRVV